MKILFSYLITIFLTIGLFSSTEAHKAIGKDPAITMENIKLIENYFKTHYNLTLKNEITVYVTKTEKEYKDVLVRCNVPNAKEIAHNSYAVTSKNNTILINGSVLSKKHFLFILAHEMVHRYQFENLTNPHDDYVLLEGHADIIAEKISNYYIIARDYRIPYDELKTRDGFFKHNRQNKQQTLEQIRYYAEKVPFLNNPDYIEKKERKKKSKK